MKITKLVKDKIQVLPDVVEDGVEKMTLMHNTPTTLDEMDAFIEMHNKHFGTGRLRTVPVHNMVRTVQKAPHYISDEFVYI